jgi:hypothetical protein
MPIVVAVGLCAGAGGDAVVVAAIVVDGRSGAVGNGSFVSVFRPETGSMYTRIGDEGAVPVIGPESALGAVIGPESALRAGALRSWASTVVPSFFV